MQTDNAPPRGKAAYAAPAGARPATGEPSPVTPGRVNRPPLLRRAVASIQFRANRAWGRSWRTIAGSPRALRYRATGKDTRRMLMIACFPKSGSTYLMRLLCEITGFKRAILVPYRGPNEQDLSKILLDEHRWRDGVCQQHLKATYYNLELLRKHNIRVVVLLRNIYDVVVSLCDHIDNGGPLMPTGYTPEQFSQWPQERKWMFLIRVHIPWYFSFLMSWHEGQHQVPVHWLTYEELFEDQQDTVRQLLGFWDVPRTSEEIAHGLEAVQSQFTRFNQGVAGRGSVLPVEHKRAIAELADLCDVAPELRRRVGLETHELQSSADR